MLTGMQMHNFKSWVNSGAVRLAPLTAIFGANSSGKSSLLQMLLLLKQTTESNDRRLVLKTGNMQDGYVNLGTVGEITHGSSTDMTLGVRWRLPQENGAKVSVPDPSDAGRLIDIRELDFSTTIFSDRDNTYVRQIRYVSADGDPVEVIMARGGNNRYTIRVKINHSEPQRPQGRPRVLMHPEKCYGFSDEAIRYYQDASYLLDMVLAFEQQFRRIHYLGPLRGYPERTYNWANESPESVGMRGELAIAALLSGKSRSVYPGRRGGQQMKMEQRIARWLNEMGMAHSFKTEQINSNQYEVRLQRTQNSHEVLIPDVGFGVSQVLPVLVQCYYAPPGSTLIFEQPEIHLHPAVQSVLADVFIDVMQHRQMQIIIESHSEHLLRRLQRRIAEKKLAKDSVALYFCEMREGQSHLHELEVDLFGNIRNWPRDFFGDLTEELLTVMEAQLAHSAGAGG